MYEKQVENALMGLSVDEEYLEIDGKDFYEDLITLLEKKPVSLKLHRKSKEKELGKIPVEIIIIVTVVLLFLMGIFIFWRWKRRIVFQDRDENIAIQEILESPIFKARSKGIKIVSGKSEYWVRLSDIIYLQKSGNDVEIHTSSSSGLGIIKTKESLAKLMDRLPEDIFVRTHNSYIINIFKIQENKNSYTSFVMIGGETVPISESRKKEVKELANSMDGYFFHYVKGHKAENTLSSYNNENTFP